MSEMKVALKGLTCANCAGKIEDTLSKLSETQEVSINLLRQEMTVKLAPNASAEEMQETVERVVHKFEPEVEVAFLQGQNAEHHHAHHEHEHHHDHCGCGCDDDDDDDSSQASNTDQKATDAATPPAATATPATPGVVKPSVIPVPPTTPAADENRKEDAAKPSGEAQDTQESSGEAPQEERIDSMTAQTSGSQESGTEQITETSGKGTNAGRVAAAAAAGAVVVGGGGAAVYVTMIKGKFKFK